MKKRIELGVVCIAVSAVLSAGVYFAAAIWAWQIAQAQTPLIETPAPRLGPDITWCYAQDVFALYDCIVNAEYARQENIE